MGDTGVGKTKLLLRYTDYFYDLRINPTLPVDFKVQCIKMDGKIIRLKIW